MSKSVHSDKVPKQKPPLLPKPTHLLKKSASESLRLSTAAGLKVNISENKTMCKLKNREHGESVSNITEAIQSISTSTCDSEEKFEAVLNKTIVYEKLLHFNVSNEAIAQCSSEHSIAEQSIINSTPNSSFLYCSKALECNDNLTDLSTESGSESPFNPSLRRDRFSEKRRPDSYYDSVSLDSESTDDYPTPVGRSHSSCFSLFDKEEKEKSDRFFFSNSTEADFNSSVSQTSLDQKDDIPTSLGNTSSIDEFDNITLSERHFGPNNEDNFVDQEERKRRKAFLVAKELLTSEQVFIDVLRLIVNDFKKYVEKYSDHFSSIIPKQVFEKLINPLPQLLSLNEHLLIDLESRINNWNTKSKISDVIAKKGPFLKLYTSYIKNFEEQCNFLDECCQKYPKFAKVLKDFESSDRCKKLTLKHYMLKPVQRIPQYRLLLQEYLENLDLNTTEYKDTQTALHIIHDVLNHANSSIKQGDYLSKLLQIQSLLGNYEIIKPGREFIKEGELYKLSRKEMQLRYFILLTDCLLYTTYYTSVSGLRVKYELPLCGMKVYLQQMDQTEFSVITSTRSFTLRAKNEVESSEWVNALQSAIREKNKKQLSFVNCNVMAKNLSAEPLKLGKEAPVWIQDKQTTMCQLCTAEFTVTFRRHHCRSCGKVVCGICSNNKAPLQYLKFQPARVCEECHDYLLKEFLDPSNNMFERVKVELGLSDEQCAVTIDQLKLLFKKFDNVKKIKKFIPQRLKEVSANDSGSLMSGWLYKKGKRGWKKFWFVLKDQVLYIYKASHDVVAHNSIPVLGYTVSKAYESSFEEMESNLIFKLEHPGQTPLVFSAPDTQAFEMWLNALKGATTL